MTFFELTSLFEVMMELIGEMQLMWNMAKIRHGGSA